jgi:hypothetical protein
MVAAVNQSSSNLRPTKVIRIKSGMAGNTCVLLCSALSAYDRQQQQIEIAIAAAINGGSVDSPDRNGSSASSHAFSVNNDEFVRRLIEVVKQEPCLYNSNHEHYGNKHMSAQFRVCFPFLHLRKSRTTGSSLLYRPPSGKDFAKSWTTRRTRTPCKCSGKRSVTAMCVRGGADVGPTER